MFPTIDRYSEYTKNIIPGAFYESLGIILPYRSGPTQLLLETSEPNTEFGLYLNEIWAGNLMSDVNGNVEIKRFLEKGEIVLTLRSTQSQQDFNTYLTVREWALWAAAYAENIEVLDDQIKQLFENASIETAEHTALETVYGENFKVYADLNQSTESYRHQLHGLRMAYRDFGGNVKGLSEAIGAFTQIEPFAYSRRYWGPNWILNQEMLENSAFTRRSSQLTSTGNITGVEVLSAEADVLSAPTTAHELAYTAATNTLTWTPDGSAGKPVFASDGLHFLPGPSADKAVLLGRSTATYQISNSGSNQNNHLYLNIDKKGLLDIELTTNLPTPAPADILTDIQAAMTADINYGASYAGFQSLYNSLLLLSSDTIADARIEVLDGVYNCAGDIFGFRSSDLLITPSSIEGIEFLAIEGTSLNVTGECDFLVDYLSGIDKFRMRWASPTGTFPSGVLASESGWYSITDSLGLTLKVYLDFDVLAQTTSFQSFTIGFARQTSNADQHQGMWLEVNKEALPVGDTTDTLTLYDDVTDGYAETPDAWHIDSPPGTLTSSLLPSLVHTDRETPDSPTEAFRYRITDAGSSELTVIGKAKIFPLTEAVPRDSSYPLRTPGLIYDYENYEVRYSAWLTSHGSGATEATLAISFDGGVTWESGTPQALTPDTDGLGLAMPDFLDYSTPIPADIKRKDPESIAVIVAVILDKPSTNLDVTLESPKLQVKYISSGFLGNSTIDRSISRQYLGHLVWLWSQTPLTLKEKAYLGLPHAISDKTNPLAGVTMDLIDLSTPTGKGLLEYSFTAIGEVKKLRWTPNGTTHPGSTGWQTLTADGLYTLYSPDGTYIKVDVLYDSLPRETRDSDVVISNQVTDRGQSQLISPATTKLDLFDATEYDADLNPINLFGAISESDFSFCDLVNLDIADAEPLQYSFLSPNVSSPQTGETLELSLVATNWEATLDYACDENQVKATLYEDELPVPNTMWSFDGSNKIIIPNSHFISGDLSNAAQFTLDYRTLYQATTPVIDMSVLNASFADYGWWADYFLQKRYEAVVGAYDTRSPVYFDSASGRAILENISAMDMTNSYLWAQRATEKREISKNYWRFIDDVTIQIDKAYLVDGQYYLDHQELRSYNENDFDIVFQHRSGSDSVACEAATWETIKKNESLDIFQGTPHPCHQLRLSVSGIRDIRDFNIRSLTLKGLKLRGSDPQVPGLTDFWLGE